MLACIIGQALAKTLARHARRYYIIYSVETTEVRWSLRRICPMLIGDLEEKMTLDIVLMSAMSMRSF